MLSWAGRTLVSGTVASLTSTAALALAARAEGQGALQPVNATSHWLNGEGAADVTRADLRHTAIGYATHHAATVFWAAVLEASVVWRRPRGWTSWAAQASGVAVLAAATDYLATPKRFTPGWEFVLSKRAMAPAYAAMAAGLAVASVRRRDWSSGRRAKTPSQV